MTNVPQGFGPFAYIYMLSVTAKQKYLNRPDEFNYLDKWSTWPQSGYKTSRLV